MKIDDLLDFELLVHHQIHGLVGKQDHPVLPLRIYNYTNAAQFEPHWGDGTIDYCRGLIVHRDTTDVIARPFKKFHNLNTTSIPETMEENLPFVEPSITKKIDGSLGIYYTYDGFEGIATRGSFTSPQAQWATAWYNKKKAFAVQEGVKIKWLEGYTPLFEIVYAENRIVVNYDFEELVLLALVHNESGVELPWSRLKNLARSESFRLTERVEGIAVHDLKNDNIENEEGYVISYPQIGKDPLKVKVKMADYVRLHRVVTGMNPRSVWEMLKAGKDMREFESGYPAPFIDWLTKWRVNLETAYTRLWTNAVNSYKNKTTLFPIEGISLSERKRLRAEFARYVMIQPKELHNLLFMIYDGKIINDAVWDSIEPRGDATFRTEGE
jgi:RNA ligase